MHIRMYMENHVSEFEFHQKKITTQVYNIICIYINNNVYAYTWIIYYLGVSKNRGGPPESSIFIGFSIINHPFWGITIFGLTPIYLYIYIHTHTPRVRLPPKINLRNSCFFTEFEPSWSIPLAKKRKINRWRR